MQWQPVVGAYCLGHGYAALAGLRVLIGYWSLWPACSLLAA